MLGRRGGDLSGGQQQQLAIGRALAMEPQPADPRRAHRGHPALDHQGHRARHPRARRDRRDGDPAGRAVLRLRALARRPVPGDGARRDRRARPRRGHGRATECAGCWRYDRPMQLAEPVAASWRAELALGFENVDGEDRARGTAATTARSSCRSRSIPKATGVCHAIVVHPPGGIAGGDELHLDVRTRQARRTRCSPRPARASGTARRARGRSRRSISKSTGSARVAAAGDHRVRRRARRHRQSTSRSRRARATSAGRSSASAAPSAASAYARASAAAARRSRGTACCSGSSAATIEGGGAADAARPRASAAAACSARFIAASTDENLSH